MRIEEHGHKMMAFGKKSPSVFLTHIDTAYIMQLETSYYVYMLHNVQYIKS